MSRLTGAIVCVISKRAILGFQHNLIFRHIIRSWSKITSLCHYVLPLLFYVTVGFCILCGLLWGSIVSYPSDSLASCWSWAIEWHRSNTTTTDLRCHGNQIIAKIDYYLVCMGDISEILASSRGFSGSSYGMLSDKFYHDQPPLASKFETKWAIAHWSIKSRSVYMWLYFSAALRPTTLVKSRIPSAMYAYLTTTQFRPNCLEIADCPLYYGAALA